MISYDDFEHLIAQYASPGIRPGLDRIGRLLSLLKDPQGRYPAVHVVGTNGKGSTCAFLSSVFQAAGYKTALYTSPHLENPGERLLIDGTPLPPEEWLKAAETTVEVLKNDSLLRSDPPSYFELVTAVALLLAAKNNVDIAVVEAGLGGRLDATNLLSDVACTVIASISMDHTEYLGSTLEQIAGEKFAVVRPKAPACFLGDAEALVPLFEDFCHKAHALPLVVSRDTEVRPVALCASGSVFDFKTRDESLTLKSVEISLLGRYQLANASLALAALSRLQARFKKLTEPSIRKGMRDARWPGRLEIVGREPLVLLDGGHNPDGVQKLVLSVKELWPEKRIGVVYGVMKDKDYAVCLETLSTLKGAFYATCVPGMERSLAPANLKDHAETLPWREGIDAFENPLDAVQAASKKNDVVLVCGSLYLIGWIRPRLRELLQGKGPAR